MFKNFMKASAIALMCLILSACGTVQTPQVEQQTPQVEQQTENRDVFDSLPDSVTCIVQISVNPEFEVHVNDDGVIENVICLNDNAQTICSVIDISGKNYKDGVMELLTTAYNQGYITQDSRVSFVAVRKSTAQYDVPFATDEIVSDFTSNVISIGFEVQNKTVTVEEQTETQSSSQGSTDNFTHTESTADRPDSIIDENGNTVLYTYHDNGNHASVELIRPDGSSQKSFYDKDGVIYEEHIVNNNESGIALYENGVLKSIEVTRTDGSTQKILYDKDGVICEEHTTDNGISGIALYENGVIKLYSFTNTDGSSGKVYYNSDGVAISGKDNHADGSWSELIYENGKPYIENVYGLTPEGHTIKNTFHPNGKIAETVDYYAHNGQEMIYRYDENGTITETFGYDNYGRRIHTVYNADGTSVSVRTNEDGSTTVLD